MNYGSDDNGIQKNEHEKEKYLGGEVKSFKQVVVWWKWRN